VQYFNEAPTKWHSQHSPTQANAFHIHAHLRIRLSLVARLLVLLVCSPLLGCQQAPSERNLCGTVPVNHIQPFSGQIWPIFKTRKRFLLDKIWPFCNCLALPTLTKEKKRRKLNPKYWRLKWPLKGLFPSENKYALSGVWKSGYNS